MRVNFVNQASVPLVCCTGLPVVWSFDSMTLAWTLLSSILDERLTLGLFKAAASQSI